MKQIPTVTWEVHVSVDWIEPGRWTIDSFGAREEAAREERDYFKALGRVVKLVRVTSVREVVE